MSSLKLFSVSTCIGFIRQGFHKEAEGMAVVRRVHKISLCWTEALTAGSERELQLAKIKPMISTCWVSVGNRKGRKSARIM